ncbi:hypothetical protein [Paenibacillus cremeus]|uniref:Uncharacterized protein n=1 Tax=Paenibacillus cremeus TaxID=2163881 RepID=A0A559KCQ4_9BACL|nr:hypothetical protein [Paenibacillus cremeus]TVY09900.1 hypothetical protein FPZ49_11045 [Paenibacillus cremeus]
MLKYKSEIKMFGVSLKPHYARKQYTVILHARREILKAQKLHYSYNVPARILVYLQTEDKFNEWELIDQVEVDISAT